MQAPTTISSAEFLSGENCHEKTNLISITFHPNPPRHIASVHHKKATCA